MADIYVQDSRRLNGQPKRTISDYVESNGILVPRRFDTLREARSSGVPILVRSEYAQEYDGVSGILKSFTLSTLPDTVSVDEVKTKVLDFERDIGQSQSIQYCELLGIDPRKFAQDVSFSFWEQISGVERVIVADSAILGRYHIISWRSSGLGSKDNVYNYVIFENGQISKEFGKSLNLELMGGTRDLVEVYENVRRLSNFDPNHCPIMEFQFYNGKNYFLQYHRTRDFKVADFSLDRDTSHNEIEAMLVRGVTPQDGITANATLIYTRNLDGSYGSWTLPSDEVASYDIHYGRVFTELMVRKRKLQMIHSDNLSFELLKVVAGHIGRSKLFKPEVSVFHNADSLFTRDDFGKMIDVAYKTGENQTIPIHVVSDGRRAFVKRV